MFDNAALKVFSSCCQLWELISISRIYHTEKLEVNRKTYKNTDVIYFITPTEESINRIVEDFPDDIRYKYGAVHLCLTSNIDDEKLLPIAKNKHLAKRIASFYEINLDFYMFNDQVYHLGQRNVLPLYKLIREQPSFLNS